MIYIRAMVAVISLCVQLSAADKNYTNYSEIDVKNYIGTQEFDRLHDVREGQAVSTIKRSGVDRNKYAQWCIERLGVNEIDTDRKAFQYVKYFSLCKRSSLKSGQPSIKSQRRALQCRNQMQRGKEEWGSYPDGNYDIWTIIASFLHGGINSNKIAQYSGLTSVLCSQAIPLNLEKDVSATCFSLSPCGNYVLIGTSNGLIKCYNFAQKSYIAFDSASISDSAVSQLVWLDGITWIGIFQDQRGIAIAGTINQDGQSGEIIETINIAASHQQQGLPLQESYASTAYGASADGGIRFAIDALRTLKVFNGQGELISLIEHPEHADEGPITRIAVSNSGLNYILCNAQGTRVWLGQGDAEGIFHDTVLPNGQHAGMSLLPIAVAMHRNQGNYSLSVAAGDINVWDCQARRHLFCLDRPFGERFYGGCFNELSDKEKIVAYTQSGMIFIFDAATGSCLTQTESQPLHAYPIHGLPASIQVSRDDKSLFIYGGEQCFLQYNIDYLSVMKQLTPQIFDTCYKLLAAGAMAKKRQGRTKAPMLCTLSLQDDQALCDMRRHSFTTASMLKNFMTHCEGLIRLESPKTGIQEAPVAQRRVFRKL